jgi:hypothetical protein
VEEGLGARIDNLLVAQIQHHEVVVDGGTALDLFLKFRLLVEVQIHPLFHIG